MYTNPERKSRLNERRYPHEKLVALFLTIALLLPSFALANTSETDLSTTPLIASFTFNLPDGFKLYESTINENGNLENKYSSSQGAVIIALEGDGIGDYSTIVAQTLAVLGAKIEDSIESDSEERDGYYIAYSLSKKVGYICAVSETGVGTIGMGFSDWDNDYEDFIGIYNSMILSEKVDP